VQLLYLGVAGKVRVIVDKHATRTTDSHAARGAESKGAIQIFFYVDKAIEYGYTPARWHDEFLKTWGVTIFRVISLDLKCYLIRVTFSHNTS